MKYIKILLAFLLFSLFMEASNDRAIYRKNYGTENKVALVIGNSNYRDFSILKNTLNDAQDMQQILKDKGFDVLHLKDGDLESMESIVEKFSAKLSKGGVGFFYYAGHGLEVDGKNYLVPVGAKISKKSKVKYRSLPVNMVIDEMEESRNRLNIVVLDACRNDPFSRSGGGGLSQINNAEGMYIAFATAPGKVASDGGSGRNGLFTKHLIKNIGQSNLTLNEVFKKTRASVYQESNNKQMPWTSSSVIGDFYFKLDDKTNGSGTPHITLVSTSTSKEEQYLLNLGIDRELISKAKSGIPQYEANLGWELWQKGNFSESAKWDKRAAEHGNKYGQKRTGLHYQRGLGAEKDFKKAAYWHELAAEQGDDYSKFNLALMYANGGHNLSKNLIESYKWAILANEIIPTPEGNDKLLKDLENRLSKSEKADAKILADKWLNKQNNKNTINRSTKNKNKNLKLIIVPNKDKIAKLEIDSLKNAQYDNENKTLEFLNWGYVNSQEKIIDTHSSKISFKYKISNQKLKDKEGEIWQPKLRIILSEKKLSKDNIKSKLGIKILFPSNDENISISSKYGLNAQSKYRGNEILKPSIWHSVNINFNKNSFSLIVNGINVIDSKKIFSKEQYYLVISSWNSADFLVRDLNVK